MSKLQDESTLLEFVLLAATLKTADFKPIKLQGRGQSMQQKRVSENNHKASFNMHC